MTMIPRTDTLNQRLTIGLLAPYIGNLSELVWSGIDRAVREHDANLLYFSGGPLHVPFYHWAQENIVYELVDRAWLNGLVISSSALETFVARDVMEGFLKRYQPLPMISQGTIFAGIPSVLIGEAQGIRTLMRHLIVDHGYRRVAFICGPEDASWARERYRGYYEALREYDLPFDPKLVAPHVTNWYQSGQAFPQWLADHDLLPGRDIEAVVAPGEGFVEGVVPALRQRGIRIPDDLAVVGYDDSSIMEASSSPVTTIRPPFSEMGQESVNLLCLSLAGIPVPEQTVLSGRLIIRQSCGCLDPILANIETGMVGNETRALSEWVSAHHEQIIAKIADAIGANPDARPWAKQLLMAQVADLSAPTAEPIPTFLTTLDTILQQANTKYGNLWDWQHVMTVLRRELLPALGCSEHLLRAERYWQQARIKIGDVVRMIALKNQDEERNFDYYVQHFEMRLMHTFAIRDALDTLVAGLQQLEIGECYLVLYENPQPYTYPQPAPEWSRLILAYRDHSRIALDLPGVRFRSQDLLPPDFRSHDRAYHLMIRALHFREHQLGVIILESHPRFRNLYDRIQATLSNALYGEILMEQVQHRTAELASANDELHVTLDHLRQTQQQLIEAERLAALGQIAANIAHELNTPLGAIQASADNIRSALAQALTAFPPLFQELTRTQQRAFITLLQRALQTKQSLTSKEERQRRKTLRDDLYQQNIAHAAELADTLVDLGIYSDVARFAPVLQHPANTELLNLVAGLTAPYHQSETMLNAVDRASKAVFALRTYAHEERALQSRQLTDIPASLDSVLTLYQNHLKQGVEVVKHYADVPEIVCYPDDLKQVWMHLILNAIQSMGGKGRLEIMVSSVETHGRVSLQVEITDSGPGIPHAIKDRIFEPFFTTKPVGEGSGLGLDICKKIIDKHQGRIDFESQPGKTTFSVWLPNAESV